MNRVIMIGNLTRNPDVRTTQMGVTVCNFSIAVSRRFKNPQAGQTETDFFDVQAWRQLGELCGQYLAKGRKVAVVGSLQTREYTGRDGTKKRAVEIVADEVEFLSPREQAAPGREAFTQTDEPTPFTKVEDEELPF